MCCRKQALARGSSLTNSVRTEPNAAEALDIVAPSRTLADWLDGQGGVSLRKNGTGIDGLWPAYRLVRNVSARTLLTEALR